MSYKSVTQECQIRVSSKSVLPERCAIVSSKGVLQECHLSVSTQGVSQVGSLENVRNKYCLCSSTYVSAFGFVGFILFSFFGFSIYAAKPRCDQGGHPTETTLAPSLWRPWPSHMAETFSADWFLLPVLRFNLFMFQLRNSFWSCESNGNLHELIRLNIQYTRICWNFPKAAAPQIHCRGSQWQLPLLPDTDTPNVFCLWCLWRRLAQAVTKSCYKECVEGIDIVWDREQVCCELCDSMQWWDRPCECSCSSHTLCGKLGSASADVLFAWQIWGELHATSSAFQRLLSKVLQRLLAKFKRSSLRNFFGETALPNLWDITWEKRIQVHSLYVGPSKRVLQSGKMWATGLKHTGSELRTLGNSSQCSQFHKLLQD